MKRFTYLFVLVGAICTGLLINRSINWLKSDCVTSNTIKVSSDVDPSTIKNADSTKLYKVDHIVKLTYGPSKTPLLYETKRETLETSKMYTVVKPNSNSLKNALK